MEKFRVCKTFAYYLSCLHHSDTTPDTCAWHTLDGICLRGKNSPKLPKTLRESAPRFRKTPREHHFSTQNSRKLYADRISFPVGFFCALTLHHRKQSTRCFPMVLFDMLLQVGNKVNLFIHNTLARKEEPV